MHIPAGTVMLHCRCYFNGSTARQQISTHWHGGKFRRLQMHTTVTTTHLQCDLGWGVTELGCFFIYAQRGVLPARLFCALAFFGAYVSHPFCFKLLCVWQCLLVRFFYPPLFLAEGVLVVSSSGGASAPADFCTVLDLLRPAGGAYFELLREGL